MGSPTTDPDGNYEFAFAGDIPPGTYYAVATRKVIRKKSVHHPRQHVCKVATSADVVVN